MATITLIFEDTLDGEVTANVLMHPPQDNPESALSPAQSLGMTILEAAFGTLADTESEIPDEN